MHASLLSTKVIVSKKQNYLLCAKNVSIYERIPQNRASESRYDHYNNLFGILEQNKSLASYVSTKLYRNS